MNRKWFYTYQGQTLGPFTAAKMKELAAQGTIVPQGKIWAEGGDPQGAVPAATAIDFKSIVPPAPVPSPGPAGPPPAKAGLPLKKKKLGRSSAGSRPGKRIKREGAGSKPGVPLKKKAPAPPPSSAATLPLAQPVQPAPGPPTAPLSLQDLFRKARFALEQWIDDEDSIDLILAGDMEAIKQDPDLERILGPMKVWGQDIVGRLWKHLEFTVENRRKYYLALVARKKEEN